jgi:hypothetical protein
VSPNSRYCVTVTCTDPLPLEVVAVMVVVPIPTRVASPAEGVEITFWLLEVHVAELVTLVPACVAVKVTVVPAPPFAVRLIVFPALDVTAMVDDCPTVTVVDPLTPPEVAVMVTPLVVFARALIRPLLLTLTWLGTELVQVTPLTFPVVPSLKFAVAIICKVLPICRLGVAGVTVRLVRVGFTKKPRQPAKADIKTTVQTVNSSVFRLELEIIAKPREVPSADDWLVAYGRL